MLGLEFVRAYIEGILVLTHSTWLDHLKKLAHVFERIQNAGLKVNAIKSFFGKNAVKYLGYWITHKGIQPLPKMLRTLISVENRKCNYSAAPRCIELTYSQCCPT